MLKVVAWGGEPATGKSTVMRELLSGLGPRIESKFGCLSYEIYPDDKITVLGRYVHGQVYGGTDRLPMNVQPTAEQFLVQRKDEDQTVWFEGDRLFNSKFLSFIVKQGVPYHFFILSAAPDTLSARHASRDHQNATWLKGRQTKVANLEEQFDLPMLFSNTQGDIRLIADYVIRFTRRLQEAEVHNG